MSIYLIKFYLCNVDHFSFAFLSFFWYFFAGPPIAHEEVYVCDHSPGSCFVVLEVDNRRVQAANQL